MNDRTNIVPFVPRSAQCAAEAPALMCVELRLDEVCGLEMLLRNNAGDVVAVLEYTLAFKPTDFDLDTLRTSWDLWRGSSARAS